MSAKGSGSSPQPRKSKGSYLYEEIYIADDPEPRDILHSFGRFMSSPSLIEFIRDITSIGDISQADARATRYGPESFLTIHDDDVAETHRRAAYVFGLTSSWRRSGAGCCSSTGRMATWSTAWCRA